MRLSRSVVNLWVITTLICALFSFLCPSVLFADGNDLNESNLIGDLNGDGIVDFCDFAMMAQNWLSTGPSNPQEPVVIGPPVDYIVAYPEGLTAFSPNTADLEMNSVWKCDGNDASSWHYWTGPVVITQQIDDQNNSFSQDDGYSVKIVASGNIYGQARISRNISPPVNISKCHIRVNYFIPSDPNGYVSSVRMDLVDPNGRYLYILSLPGTVGYHEVEFALAGCGNFGAANMNNLSYVRVGFNYPYGTQGTMYLDSIKAIPNYSSPRVIMCFDDGLACHYSVVRPLLNAHGFKGVFYVITGFIGGGGQQMTLQQILQLQADGHLVGNHTVDHRLWQGSYYQPPALYWERVREMVDAAKALKNMGIGTGRRYYAQPSGTDWIGSMTPEKKNQALRFLLQYNLHVRMTTDAAFVDGQVAYVPGNYPNPPRNARLAWGTIPTSFSAAKAFIDKAVQDNSLVVFYWHYISNTLPHDLTPDEFSQLLDYIQANNCQVITFQDLVQTDLD
jgi:peptidoglycan/xylan/chitin deacetylase (PgdA/CDA1 family)